MEYLDTFNEEGIFLSSEYDHDVHYKGLWHKVIRVWLYDKDGNLYLRKLKKDNKLDAINELHMRSSESVSSCFDRGMFDKLGIHFPATSDFKQACMRKIKKHKVFSDNSEIKDNYFLCDYIGEFDRSSNFFIFSDDTAGLVKCNAKGILNLLRTRTGEVIAYDVHPNNNTSSEKIFITIQDILDDPNEDTYEKYTYVVNEIDATAQKYRKEAREQEKMRKLMEKNKPEKESYKSHAHENEGVDIY